MNYNYIIIGLCLIILSLFIIVKPLDNFAEAPDNTDVELSILINTLTPNDPPGTNITLTASLNKEVNEITLTWIDTTEGDANDKYIIYNKKTYEDGDKAGEEFISVGSKGDTEGMYTYIFTNIIKTVNNTYTIYKYNTPNTPGAESTINEKSNTLTINMYDPSPLKIKDDSVACYQNNPDGSMYLTTYKEDGSQNELPFPKLMTDKDRFEDLFGTEEKRSFKEIHSELRDDLNETLTFNLKFKK